MPLLGLQLTLAPSILVFLSELMPISNQTFACPVLRRFFARMHASSLTLILRREMSLESRCKGNFLFSI